MKIMQVNSSWGWSGGQNHVLGIFQIGPLVVRPRDRDPLCIELTGAHRLALDHDVVACLAHMGECGKPLGVDHLYDLPPPNRVTYAAWDDEADALYFEGEVSAEVAELIRSGRVRGVSIELNWERPGGRLEYVNGIAPRNFEFTGLDLIVNLEPGDPEAWVQLWEEAISALSRGGTGGWEGLGLKPSGNTPDGSEARKGGGKSGMAQTEIVEGAVGFEETPTAPMEREWDADAAERRIRRWASSRSTRTAALLPTPRLTGAVSTGSKKA